MILGYVLQLHQAAGPSECARCAAKLQHPMYPSVPANRSCHRLVLLDGCLAQFQPQFQQFLHDAIRLSSFLLHDALGQALHGHVHIGQPRLELAYAAGVFQPCQLLCPLERLPAKSQIDRHRLFDQQPIHPHAPVIDPLVECV